MRLLKSFFISVSLLYIIVHCVERNKRPSKYTYNLSEQRITHFCAAIEAFEHNQWYKTIEILQFLATSPSINHADPLFHYITANLAILQFERRYYGEALRWSKHCHSGKVDVLCRFFTGVSLYLLKEYYSAFMVFRHISIDKHSEYFKFVPVLSYNMGIILYKLGGNGDEHFAESLDQLGDATLDEDRISRRKYENARKFRGVDFTIEWGPVQEHKQHLLALFNFRGERICFSHIDVAPLRITKQKASFDEEDHMLSYYFMSEEEKESFPSPHQISNRIDHHQDYFSKHSARKIPKIVLSLPEIDEETELFPQSAPPEIKKQATDYFAYKEAETNILTAAQPPLKHLVPPISSKSPRRPNVLQRFCSS